MHYQLLQQLTLKHPAVRAKLGLPDKVDPKEASDSEKMSTSVLTPTSRPEKLKQVSVQDLSAKELVAVSEYDYEPFDCNVRCN